MLREQVLIQIQFNNPNLKETSFQPQPGTTQLIEKSLVIISNNSSSKMQLLQCWRERQATATMTIQLANQKMISLKIARLQELKTNKKNQK
jgi:hypothetical protein